MRVTIELPAAAGNALHSAAQTEGVAVEIAASVAVVEWLVAQGYLDLPDVLDEDTPTEGNA